MPASPIWFDGKWRMPSEVKTMIDRDFDAYLEREKLKMKAAACFDTMRFANRAKFPYPLRETNPYLSNKT